MNSAFPPSDSAGAVNDPHGGTVPLPESTAVPDAGAPPARRRFTWQRFGGNFLILSIVAHLIFFGIAAYFVVQTIQKRKLTFQSGPKGPSAPQRDREHSVQMKKQSTMSAPPQAKRVTSTSKVSKVALPDMPAMPSMNAALSPTLLSGLGGGGIGAGMGLGGGGGGGGNGSGSINFFGARSGAAGLKGTFYDLKQDRNRRPTGLNSHQYADEVSKFVAGGWNLAVFSRYFVGPQAVSAPQIFIPSIPASEGPAAFGLEKEVQPSLWVVYYKGTVSPAQSGTYRFVGGGDDILMVRINGKMVFVRNWDNPGLGEVRTNWRPQGNYEYHYPPGNLNIPNGFAKGDAFEVSAGGSYPMEVLIGEEAPPYCFMALMIAKEGDTYEKDGSGNPLFPVFRLTTGPLPPAKNGAVYPPHAEKDGPPWRVVDTGSTSLFH